MYCIQWKITDVPHSNLCGGLSIRYFLILRTVMEDNKTPRIVAFVGSKLHLLAVSYSEKHFSFVVNTAEN